MAKQFDTTLASPQQILELERDVSHLTKMLKADRQSKGGNKIQDETEFMAEVNKKKDLLAKHAPKRLRGKNKDKAKKRADELDGFIQEHMPSAEAYYQKYPKYGCNSDFEKAVKQQVAFQTNPKLKQAIKERKYWLGRLEPDDPTIRNIENLRR